MSSLATAIAVGLTDVSLTVMLVGAIVLAGATVIMTAMPSFKWPFHLPRRRPKAVPAVTVLPPVSQRRVVTGRKPVLPPPGTVLTVPAPTPAGPMPAAGQVLALPDGRRPTTADIQRAEAVIDRFLDADPAILAATLESWLRQDDRNRRHH